MNDLFVGMNGPTLAVAGCGRCGLRVHVRVHGADKQAAIDEANNRWDVIPRVPDSERVEAMEAMAALGIALSKSDNLWTAIALLTEHCGARVGRLLEQLLCTELTRAREQGENHDDES